MYLKVFTAIAEFQMYLIDNIGQPVDVGTMGAFNKMVKAITNAIWG